MKLLHNILAQRRAARLAPSVPRVARIAFSARPIHGPWGGGNQWLLQMVRFLKFTGYDVCFELDDDVDCALILPSRLQGRMTFGLSELREHRRRNPRFRVIYRVNDNDVRKGGSGMDEFLATLDEVTDHTVFVSAWLRDYHAERWFDRDRPHSAILNGADPSIFHPIGSRPWKNGEPFRIVTHHWADNPMKGFAEYAALDALIADGTLPGFELWVIGRWPADIAWKKARTFPPFSGPKLADLLRQCHGYITASRWEPGAMHHIEGAQCGLPLIYHEDSGGNVEMGERFGVSFREDLATAALRLRDEYTTLRKRVFDSMPSGSLMCMEYLRLIQRLLAE